MKRVAMIGALMVSGCATEGELMDGGADGRYAPELMTTMTVNVWSEPLMGDVKYVVGHPSGGHISVTVNNASHTKSVVIVTRKLELGSHPIPNETAELLIKGMPSEVRYGDINMSVGESRFDANVGGVDISGQFNLTADSILFQCYEDDKIDLYLESDFCQKAHDKFLAVFTPGDSA